VYWHIVEFVYENVKATGSLLTWLWQPVNRGTAHVLLKKLTPSVSLSFIVTW